jgi:malate dehydrogenase (oxaloacetate-decarboxylating)(NADP+)
VDEKIAKPTVLGDPVEIARVAKDAEIELDGIPVVDPRTAEARERYAQALWIKRQRKGMTLGAARRLVEHPHYFSAMMVAEGEADAMVGGIEQFYPDKLHALLQAVGVDPKAKALAGIFMMVVEKNVYFVADTTVNVDPDAQTLAHIASETARLVKRLGVTPRVAFLSFSNFGGARFPASEKVAEAVRLLRESEPELEADGEMMAETALEEKLLKGNYPFSRLTGPANVLIFPDLNAGNIGYQLLKSIAKAEAIGPILVGMNRPVHILQRDIQAQDVINMAVIAAVDAQGRAK